MSVWRRKAIECVPSERQYLQEPTTTIYLAFGVVLHELRLAHQAGDKALQAKIYAFAAWCLRQKHQNIWLKTNGV